MSSNAAQWNGNHSAVLAVIRLNFALEFDEQGPALAVYGFASRYFDPAFADTVFLYVATFLVVEADADFVLEHSGHVVGAARINRQVVGQFGRLRIGCG